MLPDLINGLFEMCGGAFIVLSIVKLYHDKEVRGISWWHVGFFSAWGAWNVWFYSAVDLWLSWLGGIGIFVANTIYLAGLIYYSRKQRPL